MCMCKCGREFEKRQSIVSHKRCCLIHREGKAPKPRVAWNRNLTKIEDVRLAKLGVSVSLSLKGKPGHKMSQERKQLQSLIMTERLDRTYADGTRDQVGGYCKWFEFEDVKLQGTWELRAAKILSKWKHQGKILSWSRCTHRIPYSLNGKTHIYQPDFSVIDNIGQEFILEVKGRKSLIDDIKWEETRKHFDLVVWGLKEIKNYETE